MSEKAQDDQRDWRRLHKPFVTELVSSLERALICESIRRGAPILEWVANARGTWTEEELGQIREKLEGTGLALAGESRKQHGNAVAERQLVFWGTEGCVHVKTMEQQGSKQAVVQMLNQSCLERAQHELAPYMVQEEVPHRGRIAVLVERYNELQLDDMGEVGVPLAPLNYSECVNGQFLHIVKQIGARDPAGRLVVVQGPPGTGKTYFVRGILDAIKGTRNVLVPPDLLPKLVGPGAVHALLRFRTEQKPERLVIVIEDADALLLPRMADNISGVSTMLGLSDGLLSAALDVFIVVTTNAPRVEIDKALKRKGRLCADVHIKECLVDRANAVFRSLDGEGAPFSGRVPLADIYDAAREHAAASRMEEAS